jgi:hypothetical protein
MRKTITVIAEIAELGIRRSFKLSVGPDGDVRSEEPNCMVYGYHHKPVLSVELLTEQSQFIEYFERA